MTDRLFGPFLTHYQPTCAVGCRPDQIRHLLPCHSTGLAELFVPYAGATFNDGMYRLHTPDAVPAWNDRVWQAFPEFRRRAYCFGFDWLGRQFALDTARRDGHECLVLMLEPGAGQVMEIPATFLSFHNEEVVDYPDDALAATVFSAWAREPERKLLPSQCAGFRVPLFLGGEDTLENLEVSDLEVYWALCGQLLRQVRDLPPGTVIDSITWRAE